MNIIVLVKQVPDTTEIKLDPKTGNLIREGIDSIMNPGDRHALEAAVRMKESSGGSVTAVSMGLPQAIAEGRPLTGIRPRSAPKWPII